jgi:thymidylate synthase
MNNIDKAYTDLLQDILDNGVVKETRNGETISVFGRQIRHKMSEGFPLLTTKKMAWKTMVVELMWFLRGDTNIKFLIENGCHIWDGDAYKNYTKKYENTIKEQFESLGIQESNNLDWAKSNPPLTQEEFINKIKTDDEFANKYAEMGPIYGRMWREFDEDSYGGIDQIENLMNDLKTNPDSRRLLVTAWHPGYNQHSVLPPCHYGFQVYTRELSTQERKDIYYKSNYAKDTFPTNDNGWNNLFDGFNIPKRAISLMWNQRSVDTFLGLPFNIASYALLLEIIAKTINMVPDELVGNLGDVHLYSNHIEQAKEQISRTPYKLPKLNINTEFWPYESGECGVGPLDAVAVMNSFKDDSFCKCLLEEDLQLVNYQSHPSIKAPLSN